MKPSHVEFEESFVKSGHLKVFTKLRYIKDGNMI
jgi:hypothetical protein